MKQKDIWHAGAAGFLYSVAFLHPYLQAGIWLSFLFLFQSLTNLIHPFKKGFAWAIGATSIHIALLSSGIVHISQGSLFAALIVPFFICTYLWTTIGLWFLCTQKSITVFNLPILWIFSFVGLLSFLTYHALWICGQQGGFFFLHPFIPFVSTPLMQILIRYIPENILLFIFMASAYYISLQRISAQKIVATTLLLTILFLHIPLQKNIPRSHISFLKKTHIFNITYPKTCNASFICNDLSEKIVKIQTKDPFKKIFILTESSCQQALEINALQDAFEATAFNGSLLYGGFRKVKEHQFNTMFCIHKEKAHSQSTFLFFDKKELLPFVEYLPSKIFFKDTLLKNFFKETSPLSTSTKKRPLLKLSSHFLCVPYICSEFFMYKHPDDPFLKTPIILFCNERHFWNTMKTLMQQATQLKALFWNRPIFLVTSTHIDLYTTIAL